MTEVSRGNRTALVRECLLFQVKLFADGLRDFMLVPISLVAAIAGLLRSGEDPDREFRRVIRLGLKSERWINLFGHHEPIMEAGDAGSIDRLVTRAEEVVREQYRQGGVSRGASRAIERALDRLHQNARLDRGPLAEDAPASKDEVSGPAPKDSREPGGADSRR